MAASKEHPYRTFGRRCRELRLKRGLSQLDMVRYHDFSLSHYQKLERGDLDPRLSTLKKLAVAYRVTLVELVKGL
jgi:transcriptional regulator with XRE-family HTH domain